jgi:hypothetical protein
MAASTIDKCRETMPELEGLSTDEIVTLRTMVIDVFGTAKNGN